jgi:FKBP-type peptidyl-prolyl cis-trans isomerase
MNPVEKNIQMKGSGVEAKKGDIVIVHYTGRLQNGAIFDSSLKRNQPFPVKLGANEVIPGWEEGLIGVSKGEKLLLTIPPEKAYGEAGYPGVIPPHSTLIFEIEVIDILFGK